MNIYKKNFASIYDKIYKDKFYNDYTVFLEKIIKKEEIKTPFVLDIACGTGRLVKNLNRKNIKVEGLDGSKDMINVAKKNNKGIKFYTQDFIKFNIGKKYNIILCTFDSMNYITNKKDLIKFFKNIKNHLKKEGIFVFDFNTIHKKVKQGIKNPYAIYFGEIKGKYLSVKIKVNDSSTELHKERLYSFEEINKAISKSGLKVSTVYSDFRTEMKKPKKEQRLILITNR